MSVSVDPLWGMASTFVETQYMLIHGGASGNSPPVGSTFALKLNTNWNTSQPDMEQLFSDFQGYNLASTLSSDNKTWFMIANSTPHKFFTGNGTWLTGNSSTSFTNKGGLGAATDPATGLIYVINGFSNNGSYSMLQYSLTTGTFNSIPMNPLMVTLVDSAVVWSTVRKSMLVYGGWRSGEGTLLQGLYEFVPDGGNGVWRLLPENGDTPVARKAHCLVPAYGGTKMILFGGFLGVGDRVSSDIYSLDMPTLTWTKLTDPGEPYARAYHACAVSNDMFISWGGADKNWNVTRNNPTLVYNLKKNVWQDTYSAKPEEGEWVPPLHDNPSSLSLAAIIGIVAGIIGIVLVVGAAIYYKKRRQCKPLSVSSAGGGSSADTNIKKDTFESLKSFKSLSDDGTESGHLMSAVGVQHKQQNAYQRDSTLSHSSLGALVTAQEHFYVAPATSAVADVEGDASMYRPNEIIVRGPQAILDMRGYQDCKSTARSPHTVLP
ncbi:hypothetical protein BGZ68_003252 [Mortierella alpina]|nr:hypothetical protein BGZ68_003252 [Mortierella alpina]